MSAKLTKSVQEVSKVARGFGKNDLRYWEGKVFKPTFTENGARRESKQFSVKLQHRGERHNVPLGLANKASAAKRARDIYESVQARGWEQTLAEFHPRCASREDRPTIGAYLTATNEVASVGIRTMRGYESSLRMIAANIAGTSSGRSRFDYKKGGRAAWVKKVDALHLDILTPVAIESWKRRYLNARKGNPLDEKKGRNSANSFIRQARSLFAPKIAKLVASRLKLPDPLPFTGVSLFPRSSSRYVSRVDIRKIVSAAYTDLAAPRQKGEKAKDYQSRIEQFKIFLLAAFGGLRRNEIDKLLKEQVDSSAGTIEIRATAHFKPKSEESSGLIAIEPEVVTQLSRYASDSSGPFVIAGRPRKAGAKDAQWYRAKRHFDGLIDWLRKQGIDDQKPLHVLRKEAGSLVCGTVGLYAASRFLRHGDVRVTAEHYLDKNSAATVGMGSLLKHEQAHDDSPSMDAG